MSDKLEDLPSDEEAQMSDQQRKVLNRYAGGEDDDAPGGRSSKGSSWTDGGKWKIIGLLAVAFLLLSNSYTMELLNKAPYFGGSSMTVTLLATIIFIIIAAIVVMFL